MKYIIYWVRDNDTIMSIASKDTTFTVRLAPPVLWGDNPTKDTVWTIINNGVGNYAIHINSRDTNGIIGKYIWNFTSALDSTTLYSTPDSQYTKLFTGNDINKSLDMWIYGRDDDGLMRGGHFVVFADSAPRPIVGTYNSAVHQFQWSGIDAIDSLSTMYRILVKKGTQLGASDTTAQFIAKDWTAGSDPAFSYTATNPLPFTWVFTPPQGSGLYYFQIIARDKRGSISALPLSGANVFSY